MNQPKPQNPANTEVIAPVLREPGAWVENVYPLYPGSETPDLDSQDIAGQYLAQRLRPDRIITLRPGFTASEHHWPSIDRVVVGTRDVTHSRAVGERDWVITPKLAALATLGSFVLFNGVANYDTLDDLGHDIGYGTQRLVDAASFNHFHFGTHKVTSSTKEVTPGKVTDIHLNAATTDEAGSTQVEKKVVKEFVAQVERAEESSKVTSVTFTLEGGTSDEWATDSSIGVKDPGNAALAKARVEAAVRAVEQAGLRIPTDKLTVIENQHVLTKQQKQAVLHDAKQHGYPTIMDAISAADRGQKLPGKLGQQIKQFFTGKKNRGVSMDAKVEHAGEATTIYHEHANHVPNGQPGIPKPHLHWFIPVIPFWRRREREYWTTAKDVKQWEVTPSKSIPKPIWIHQEADQVWLRIRPEAKLADGTFIEDSWAYTGKYEHLFRDNRFADLLKVDYQNAEGEDKALRLLFVDKSPANHLTTPGTIEGSQFTATEAFEQILTKAAALQGGSVANRVRAIVVYPSENAGTDHNNPRRVGLGIDKQSPSGILGTYTPSLDLIELHMPATWNPEELEQLFAEFYGPAWVTGHEIAHATDDSDAALTMRRVYTPGLPNAHVIDGNFRANRMRRMDGILRRLRVVRAPEELPLRFDISYTITDRNDQVHVINEQVTEGDPRLALAQTSTIVGSQPTRYSGEDPDRGSDQNASEHYAETGAAVITGIEVPYDEAGVTLRDLPLTEPAELARGYRPDVRGQKIFTDAVGAVAGSFPIQFEKQPPVRVTHGHPMNDTMLRNHYARTHRIRSLRPEQMIAILARVIQTKARDNG